MKLCCNSRWCGYVVKRRCRLWYRLRLRSKYWRWFRPAKFIRARDEWHANHPDLRPDDYPRGLPWKALTPKERRVRLREWVVC